MNTTSCKAWWGLIGGVIFFMAYVSTSFGQDNSTAQPGASVQPVSAADQSAELASFQQEQRALMQEKQALVAQGATKEQLEAWRKQNAARFAAQLQRANDMAAASAAAWAAHKIPIISEVTVPEGATQEMSDFLATRADLQNRMAQLHNAQVPHANAVFQQQNSAEIQAQAQRAQVIAAQTEIVARPAPPPLKVPPGATPQMQAFLTLRDQLMRASIAVRNQNISADTATRQAAMAQWRKQNAAQLQQMQTLATNLSSTATN